MNTMTLNVMPLRIRLDREKKKSGLTFETVQQDYLLSWILPGLCEHPLLKEKLIFKGGTALKKCYNEETKEREISGLLEALKTYGLTEGIIITESESYQLHMDNLTITELPAWKWLVQYS